MRPSSGIGSPLPLATASVVGALALDMQLLYQGADKASQQLKFGKLTPFHHDKSMLLVAKVSDEKRILVAIHARLMWPKPKAAESTAGTSGDSNAVQTSNRGQSFVGSDKGLASTPRDSVRVTVHGAVKNSGVYEVRTGPNNLLNAIAMAGGLRPDCGDVVRVYRKGRGVRRVTQGGVEPASYSQPYNYTPTTQAKLTDIKLGTQSVSLKHGDEVHVLVSEPGTPVGSFLTPMPTSSWNLGLSIAFPAEFRTANAQVKNYERRVEKARKVLAEARKEASESVAALEWDLKSLELQLKAARNLAKPRSDFVVQYETSEFGKRLFRNQSAPYGTSPNGRTVSVIVNGAVKKPGTYEVRTGGNQLLSAIALAGQLTTKAVDAVLIKRKATRVRTVRTDPATNKEIEAPSQGSEYMERSRFSLVQLKLGSQNPVLQDGDCITAIASVAGIEVEEIADGYVTRTYSVGPLLDQQNEDTQTGLRRLIASIKERVTSGVSEVYPNRNTRSLLVRAHASAQREVEELLADEVQQKDQTSTRAYVVGTLVEQDKSPEDALKKLVTLIRTTINPAVFESGACSVRSNLKTRSLVVRANTETHDQIAQLLNQLRELSRIQTRTYPVADLVVPGAGHGRDLASGVAELTARVRAIVPQSWKVAGGRNSVVFREKTLSLVIRATRQMHEAVAQTLTELRRRQPGQVKLDVQLVELESDAGYKSPNGGVAFVQSLVTREPTVVGARRRGPRITVFSGREFRLSKLHKHLPLTGCAKIEGQKVVVTATIADKVLSWVIPDGYTGHADVTTAVRKALGEKAAGKGYRLKVKAKIIGLEEEEEVILKRRDKVLSAQAPMIMVTPIVIQEEEEELVLGTLVEDPEK